MASNDQRFKKGDIVKLLESYARSIGRGLRKLDGVPLEVVATKTTRYWQEIKVRKRDNPQVTTKWILSNRFVPFE